MDSLTNAVSLLYPDGTPAAGERLSERCVSDLSLGDIASAIASEGIGRDEVLAILTRLCTDPRVIEYRQATIEELTAAPDLVAGLKKALPKIAELGWYADSHRVEGSPLKQAVWRLGELELYVDCLNGLHDLFAKRSGAIESPGLRRLLDAVEERRGRPAFASLSRELPKLAEGLRKRKSVTVGINLDERLRPVEAALLSVNERPFSQQSLIDRLLGKQAESERFESAVPLRQTPRPANAELYPTGAFPLAPLFQDLDRMLSSLTRPLAAALRTYIQVNTSFLQELRPEIAFFIGAADLLGRLKAAGLPLCRPEILDREARETLFRGFYNLPLALHMLEEGATDLRERVVTNDVDFGERGRIFILTGPNQGGKTTFTQGVGIAQVFSQVGLLAPAQSAGISPADLVITHFPIEEKGTFDQGRLAEEAARLSALFAEVTRHSLILLNESLSSTSPGESLYLAEDIVSALRLLGTRAIFATHLHELAYRIDEINRNVAGASSLASLVAEADATGNGSHGAQRTFRIAAGPPIGKSYARDIAERFGISLASISAKLKARKVL